MFVVFVVYFLNKIKNVYNLLLCFVNVCFLKWMRTTLLLFVNTASFQLLIAY